ncbi:MAG TPA: hypothetical protein VH440_05240 [Candidatus Limnocylindrales bacterium]|jgi:hypothetical protein
MRSGLALLAAIWFVGAAWFNQNDATTSSDVNDVVKAVAQTLFLGLAVLSLALVDWSEVLDFVNVSTNPTVAPGEPDRRES